MPTPLLSTSEQGQSSTSRSPLERPAKSITVAKRMVHHHLGIPLPRANSKPIAPASSSPAPAASLSDDVQVAQLPLPSATSASPPSSPSRGRVVKKYNTSMKNKHEPRDVPAKRPSPPVQSVPTRSAPTSPKNFKTPIFKKPFDSLRRGNERVQ